MRALRLVDAPIVGPDSHPSIGTNINGPSLIEAPPWVAEPLGRYYLYFADHKGAYIRLAVADELTGPWRVHVPGTLQLAHSCFLTEPPTASDDELAALHEAHLRHFGDDYSFEELLADAVTPHIASPDVHLDHDNERVVMYFHGLDGLGRQVTRVALAGDGLAFRARPEVLCGSYLRMWRPGGVDGMHYGLTMPGQFVRSADGLGSFERGPRLFEPAMRHCAVRLSGQTLEVFWTRAGDTPESILVTEVDVSGDWSTWSMGPTRLLLSPELPWEGSGLPLAPSRRGAAHGPVHQLRDPAIFEEDGRTYLLYAGAGESAIGIAELTAAPGSGCGSW